MEKEKKETYKYWEEEKGELVEFGHRFMRCYDKAGKLQFGKIINHKNGQKDYVVAIVLDRQELFESKEGAPYLMQTLDDWKEVYKNGE